MLPYPHLPGHYTTLCHCHSCNPTLIVTINALSKSDGIQNLKITDLCGHLLFDSMDPALLAHVGSTQVPFLMCTLEIPQKIAAQVLALNLLLSLLLSFSLKLSFSQTMSFSCIFVFASSFICMDLSIMQTQHP